MIIVHRSILNNISVANYMLLQSILPFMLIIRWSFWPHTILKSNIFTCYSLYVIIILGLMHSPESIYNILQIPVFNWQNFTIFYINLSHDVYEALHTRSRLIAFSHIPWHTMYNVLELIFKNYIKFLCVFF